jgi:hypothetical protein
MNQRNLVVVFVYTMVAGIYFVFAIGRQHIIGRSVGLHEYNGDCCCQVYVIWHIK